MLRASPPRMRPRLIEGRSNRSELSREKGSDSMLAERVQRLQDRVVAEPWRGAVGGGADHLQPHREHALCLHSDVQVRRLARDREVARVAALDQELGAAVDLLLRLLVGDHRQHHPHAAGVAQLLERAHHRRQRALHVVGAAAVDAVALHHGLELLRASGHDVEVAVEDHRRPLGRADPRGQHGQAADLQLVDRDVARLEPSLHETGGLADPLAVGGVVPDQALGEGSLVHGIAGRRRERPNGEFTGDIPRSRGAGATAA